MQYRLIYNFVCVLFSVGCMAQEVQINEPPKVSQLMDTWISRNRTNPGLVGWRLQLVSSTDRSRMESAKATFLSQFPDVPADWVHEKPYYKLRAGAFRTRLEAAAFLENLGDAYQGAYPAQDRNIHPRDFIRP